MAYTTINKSTDYFNTKLYTGNGSSSYAITGVGHQPDFVWIKKRDGTVNHLLHDSIRGVTKLLVSNTNAAEDTNTNILNSFDSDGFTVGSNSASNDNNGPFASWNWKAGTTSGQATNSYSTITPTSISFNQTSGFSIVKYTGNGTAGAGVPHGLGKKPEFVIIKKTSATDSWICYHQGISNNGTTYIVLNSTNGNGTSNNPFNGWQPDTTNFSLGSAGDTNASGATFIAYCFANVNGFSKIGSYTGSGGTNYPFIYTGFKPAFVMVKRTNSTSNWVMYDNKRQYNNIEGQYNPQRPRLASNLNSAESSFTSDNGVDLLSNGFVVRDNSNDDYTINISGSTYIYMAFAEAPLVGSNNVPCTAR
ncbi:hypothetical protein N9J64_00350 [bacterium]|nr:hypothetical protein [bacterium]